MSEGQRNNAVNDGKKAIHWEVFLPAGPEAVWGFSVGIVAFVKLLFAEKIVGWLLHPKFLGGLRFED